MLVFGAPPISKGILSGSMCLSVANTLSLLFIISPIIYNSISMGDPVDYQVLLYIS